MKNKTLRHLAYTSCASVALWISGHLNAAVPFEESFDSMPASGWTTEYSGTNASQRTAATPRIESYEGHNWLRLQRNSSTGSVNAAYYYTGTGSGTIPDGSQIATLSGSVTMRLDFQGGSQSGIMLHAQDSVYSNPTGYYIAIKPGSGGASGAVGGLGIYLNPGNHTQPGTELAFDRWVEGTPSIIDNDYSYRLEFSITTDAIAAKLWQLDDNDTPIGSSPYAEVSYTFEEQPLLSGYFGIRSMFGGSVMTAYYRDLSMEVTVIPEAGKIAAFSGLIILGLGLVRRRRIS